jgi:uncharacterized membrane protein
MEWIPALLCSRSLSSWSILLRLYCYQQWQGLSISHYTLLLLRTTRISLYSTCLSGITSTSTWFLFVRSIALSIVHHATISSVCLVIHSASLPLSLVSVWFGSCRLFYSLDWMARIDKIRTDRYSSFVQFHSFPFIRFGLVRAYRRASPSHSFTFPLLDSHIYTKSNDW